MTYFFELLDSIFIVSDQNFNNTLSLGRVGWCSKNGEISRFELDEKLNSSFQTFSKVSRYNFNFDLRGNLARWLWISSQEVRKIDYVLKIYKNIKIQYFSAWWLTLSALSERLRRPFSMTFSLFIYSQNTTNLLRFKTVKVSR